MLWHGRTYVSCLLDRRQTLDKLKGDEKLLLRLPERFACFRARLGFRTQMRPLGLAGLSGLRNFWNACRTYAQENTQNQALELLWCERQIRVRSLRVRVLEPVAVSEADAVQALVVFLGIGVRGVLEVDRQIVVLVEVVADLDRNVKQHA